MGREEIVYCCLSEKSTSIVGFTALESWDGRVFPEELLFPVVRDTLESWSPEKASGHRRRRGSLATTPLFLPEGGHRGLLLRAGWSRCAQREPLSPPPPGACIPLFPILTRTCLVGSLSTWRRAKAFVLRLAMCKFKHSLMASRVWPKGVFSKHAAYAKL